MTKHPYLKEILKTVGKGILYAGITLAAGAFAFEFAAVYLNLLAAGYVAGATVTTIGAAGTISTCIKDILTMRQRVQKQQEKEGVQDQFQKLNQKIEQINPKQHREQTMAPKRIARHPIHRMIWGKQKTYDDAA